MTANYILASGEEVYLNEDQIVMENPAGFFFMSNGMKIQATKKK